MLYRHLRSNYYSIIEPSRRSCPEYPNTINEDKIVYSTSSNKPVKGYTKNSTVIVERKLYIVDDLLAKALIGIDIIKPERIIVDLGNDVIRIGAYNNIEVPIIAIIRGPRTSATVYSSKLTIILALSNVAVLIIRLKRKLKLPDDRDLIFELRILDTLSVYTYIVDYNISKILVRNNINKPITLSRN